VPEESVGLLNLPTVAGFQSLSCIVHEDYPDDLMNNAG
jgi:hypothetical protein